MCILSYLVSLARWCVLCNHVTLQSFWGLQDLLRSGSFTIILTMSRHPCLVLYFCQTELLGCQMSPFSGPLCLSCQYSLSSGMASSSSILPSPSPVSVQTRVGTVSVSHGSPLCWHACLFTVLEDTWKQSGCVLQLLIPGASAAPHSGDAHWGSYVRACAVGTCREPKLVHYAKAGNNTEGK